METKEGEIFEYNGEWYQCIVGNGCENCAFNERKCYTIVDECGADRRKDNKNVIFKKLEKVGEPYISSRNKKRYQLYRCFCLPIITKDRRIEIGDANWVGIEIKQNKEDMEENKLNLKPFDIQKAREGKPVCTRDGCKARIICFDSTLKNYPLVVLVDGKAGEYPYTYTAEGKFDEDGKNSDFDLMMLPEKRSGWMNVYKHNLYDTESEAKRAHVEEGYIDTIKIEWEE